MVPKLKLDQQSEMQVKLSELDKLQKSNIESMQSSTEEEMIMVTSIEELNITGLISRKQPESEDINLKEVDNYMEMFLMESTEAKIQEVLPS